MKTTDPTASPAAPSHDQPVLRPVVSFALIVLLGSVLLFVLPRPASVTVQGWRMLAIFACTMLAIMLRPMASGAIVFMGLTAAVLANVLTMSQALTGYAASSVWLVVAAFFIARAMLNTGLARRIALLFVRAIGRTSLGLGYALSVADLVLAAIIPSNSARVGGVLLPVTRSLSTLYNSHPGQSAALLGTYLMLTIYNADLVACAMFLTAQAANPMAARLAQQGAQITMTWPGWFLAASLPGLVTLLVLPWMIYRLTPPEIKVTPQAADEARRELKELGPLSRTEKLVLVVFVLVCGLWATTPLHNLDATTVALLGACVLLMTKTLTWSDAMKEHVAWDVFVWYGGLLRMGEALNEFGVTKVFAQWVSSHFQGWPLAALLAVSVLIYFYIHYVFASMTTHYLSLYVPFIAILIAAGAPPLLTAYALAFYTNLSASLTHYGTTHAPIVFAAGYVSTGRWWKIGLLISFVNLAIFTAVGLAWWKLLKLW
jgi:divalent anion:Na+ symporter, DASS family